MFDPKPITVRELIEHLKQFDQDLPVANYKAYEDFNWLQTKEIEVRNAAGEYLMKDENGEYYKEPVLLI